MEALIGLANGFAEAFTLTNLFYVLLGVTAGTIVGILPGLGPPATIALLLPLTINLEPTTGLIMLAGIYYGAKYGGSTTSILLNIPGESASVVTTLDGYQMARQGRAGAALGMAAIASFVAGTVGVLGFTFLAPVVTAVALNIGPPEYAGIMVFALASVVLLAGDSIVKGMLSALAGLLLATVGVDIISGADRYTFGQIDLLDGIEFIALSVGVFAVAEVLVNIEQKMDRPIFTVPRKLRELMPTKKDLTDSRFAMAQGSVIGFLVGALPGAGSTVASFLSYTVQRRFSPNKDRFGKGAVDGVAAPEAANNSETGGAMIPLFSLGIPGSGTTAILLGALILYGLDPGPLLFQENPDVVWPIIASMYIGNVMLLVLNLPLVPLFASVLRIPYHLLYPGILIVSVIGVYSVRSSMFDVVLLAVFGLVGYLMRKTDVPAAPLVLAFVLGPLAERAVRQALIISQNDWSIFLTRPVALGFLVLALLLFVGALVGRGRAARREVLEIDA
ncbi:tripartite tricarboxylate transporter permease [Saccharopolyspora sp. 5N708]|uniref:tripartite tricarboxylate transporter permease n=1 Tax=Saccharopolyspora sp. 5N708 TaxID=3457424 RepID=UPI003FD11E2F